MSKAGKQPRPDPASLGLPEGGADSHAHLDLGLDSEIDTAATAADDLPENDAAYTAAYTTVQDRVDASLTRAQASGLSHIGQVFLSPEAYERGHPLFARHPQVFFLLGIHPCDAMRCTAARLDAMRRAFIADPRLRALGEIGLDFYWDDCPPLVQEEALRLQLALARELDLPVVIHSREAAPQSLAILEAEGWSARPLLWHCFGGNDALPLLERILEHGWHLSIPGPVSYPANTALREALSRIPHDRLLLETDSPYLTPLPWRGKKNEPALIAFTAVTVAACLGMEPADLWRMCGANTRRFFGLDGLASTSAPCACESARGAD